MDAFTESPAVSITPAFVFSEAKNLIPLMTAYAQARKGMGALIHNKKATVTKRDGGPGYTYSWTTLDVVLNTIHEAAIGNGLVYVLNVAPRYNEQGKVEIYAERHIYHLTSGIVLTFAPFVMPILTVSVVDSQAIGSAITYTRRYCALADWGVDDGTDDGGMKASGREGQIESTGPAERQPVAQQTQRPPVTQQTQRPPVTQQTQRPPVTQQTQRQATVAPNHRSSVTTASPAPTSAAAEESGGDELHAAPPSADDGLSTNEAGDTILTLGGESLNINEIERMGSDMVGAHNWDRVFADAVVNWERKAHLESGRVQLGNLEKFAPVDLFEFYRITLRGLNDMSVQREEKRAREEAKRAQRNPAPAVA
jgi:hypothetical protein